VFCKQSLCFCERVCDAPLFLGAFWDLNHTSCVSVVAILCYWRSFLKALYEHGSLFIVLLLRMSEFRCRKSVPCTICVFLWKVERRIALFLFLTPTSSSPRVIMRSTPWFPCFVRADCFQVMMRTGSNSVSFLRPSLLWSCVISWNVDMYFLQHCLSFRDFFFKKGRQVFWHRLELVAKYEWFV